MAQTKREWHYQIFETCEEFETWQQSCEFEANIQDILPLGDGSEKVMCSWWTSPPGYCSHGGIDPSVLDPPPSSTAPAP